MKIVLIAGSPSAPSRVATLIEHVAARLAEHHAGTEVFGLDAFEPASLVYANTRAPAVARYIQAVAAAEVPGHSPCRKRCKFSVPACIGYR